eukprot:3655025-Rhodomonas_salina.1
MLVPLASTEKAYAGTNFRSLRYPPTPYPVLTHGILIAYAHTATASAPSNVPYSHTVRIYYCGLPSTEIA